MQVVKSMKLRRLTQLIHNHQNQLQYLYLKMIAKIQHAQHIEDTTAGPDMCQIIWAYHLPPCLPYGNNTQALLQRPNCTACPMHLVTVK
jgi:hypothetical protein